MCCLFAPISPIQDCQEIWDIFHAYGEVESVFERCTSADANPCFLVTFKEAGAAAAALSSDDLAEGFTMEAAHPRDQPSHKSYTAPAIASNIIEILNDHCLQEILKHLNAMDLTNAAKVCKRFNTQAQITFASEQQRLNLRFGHDHRVIEVIAENCGPKLTSLELCSFVFDGQLDSLRPVFGNATAIKLMWCIGSPQLNDLMAVCVELKSLELSNCAIRPEYAINQTFPALEQLSLYRTELSDTNFDHFIGRHSNLSAISIEGSLDIRALRSIGQHTTDLKSLKFIQSYHNSRYSSNELRNEAAYIAQLSSLTTLVLSLGWAPVDSIMEALVKGQVPLQNLDVTLYGDSIDCVVKCISKMRQMKNLSVHTKCYTRRINNEHARIFGNSLNGLQELKLIESHDYNRIRPNYQFETNLSINNMVAEIGALKILRLDAVRNIGINNDDKNVLHGMVQNRIPAVPLSIEMDGSNLFNDSMKIVFKAWSNSVNLPIEKKSTS